MRRARPRTRTTRVPAKEASCKRHLEPPPQPQGHPLDSAAPHAPRRHLGTQHLRKPPSVNHWATPTPPSQHRVIEPITRIFTQGMKESARGDGDGMGQGWRNEAAKDRGGPPGREGCLLHSLSGRRYVPKLRPPREALEKLSYQKVNIYILMKI